MTEMNPSSAEFFEAKYRDAVDTDPWHFATAEYELRRYDAVLRALEGRRYSHAFEPGCSIGVLTERLASRCDAVDACDFSATAAAAAADRCALLTGVSVSCAAFTGQESWEKFDLIILCEIGYYFSAEAWRHLVEHMVIGMRPETVLIASHWLGRSRDHTQSGDAVHEALLHPLLRSTLSERHDGFRLDRWTRTG